MYLMLQYKIYKKINITLNKEKSVLELTHKLKLVGVQLYFEEMKLTLIENHIYKQLIA